MGKKNRELFDIVVNPMEAAAVRRIFDLADQYGYGGRKTSTTLKEEGFINLRTGEPFHYSTIQNILINIAYTGVLRSGESVSEIFPDLQIITPEQFQRVQKGREQRSADYLAKCAAAHGTETIRLKDGSEAEVSRPFRSYPRMNTGSALLSGNVYCGHCGGRIFASTARKTHHPTDGSNGRVAIYKCYNRTQHKENCDGPTTYRAEKVDAVVSKLIRDILQKAGAVSEYDIVRNQIGATASDLQQQIRQAKLELSKKHIEQGVCYRTGDEKVKRPLRISHGTEYARTHIVEHEPYDAGKIYPEICFARAVHFCVALALVVEHDVEHFGRKYHARHGEYHSHDERHDH